MKPIVLIYGFALILCALIGGIVSLGYHYSRWYYLLLLFLAPIARVMMTELFRQMNEKNIVKVAILTIVSFAVMLGLLIVAAYFDLDEKSHWGMVYAGGVSSYILGLTVIGLKIPNKLEEKRKLEKKFPYV